MLYKYILVVLWLFLSCSNDVQPKPNAYLRLDYPTPVYKELSLKAPFSFEYNSYAVVKGIDQRTPKLVYPEMKATLYLTYNSIDQNLDSLLNDAYQLPYKHLSKAESIPERLFINKQHKVYGTLFTVVGNAASQYQFFLTDSLHHFLVGSLYFYAKPNYDSIFPAVDYLQKDITHLMETMEWR